jgi:very-short-patch-repair endonuclease
MKRKENFKQKSISKFGNVFSYDLENYKNLQSEIIILCPKHGPLHIKANEHIKLKTGCVLCEKNLSDNRKEIAFKAKTKKKFGNKFTYILEDYKNLQSKITIICKYHGIVHMTASSHLKSSTGCKKCSRKLAKYKMTKIQFTNDEFINKLKTLYGSIYSYDCTKYKKGQKFATIHCNKHGNIRLGVKRLLNGRGCKKCGISKGELRIMKFLYDHNIKFTHQKIYEDCKNIKPLPFDFYIPKYNILIEFDGEQHDRPVRKFGGKKGFMKQQKHDDIKNKYAENNKIQLFRIKYKDMTNIENILSNILFI